METINGEWIMKGCDESDPSALQSVEELISLVHAIGFLPLFSNTIDGFSVEERVPAYVWWTGDEAADPWNHPHFARLGELIAEVEEEIIIERF